MLFYIPSNAMMICLQLSKATLYSPIIENKCLWRQFSSVNKFNLLPCKILLGNQTEK